MGDKKQLTFDTVHGGFIKEEKPSVSEVARTVEQRKTRIAEYYKNRMTKTEQPFRVGTDDDREKRDYAFERMFPEDRRFRFYSYLTDSGDKGPLIMIPRQGNEIFYCPTGIESNGRAEAMRIDNTTIDGFLEIWNG